MVSQVQVAVAQYEAVLVTARRYDARENPAPYAIFAAGSTGFQVYAGPHDHPAGWEDVLPSTGGPIRDRIAIGYVHWNCNAPGVIWLSSSAHRLRAAGRAQEPDNRPEDIAWLEARARWLFAQAGVPWPAAQARPVPSLARLQGAQPARPPAGAAAHTPDWTYHLDRIERHGGEGNFGEPLVTAGDALAAAREFHVQAVTLDVAAEIATTRLAPRSPLIERIPFPPVPDIVEALALSLEAGSILSIPMRHGAPFPRLQLMRTWRAGMRRFPRRIADSDLFVGSVIERAGADVLIGMDELPDVTGSPVHAFAWGTDSAETRRLALSMLALFDSGPWIIDVDGGACGLLTWQAHNDFARTVLARLHPARSWALEAGEVRRWIENRSLLIPMRA